MEISSAPWWSARLAIILIDLVLVGTNNVIKLAERFPLIIHLGAAVLAFTAAKMSIGEPLLDAILDSQEFVHTTARWTTYAVAVAGMLGAGWWSARRSHQPQASHDHGHAA